MVPYSSRLLCRALCLLPIAALLSPPALASIRVRREIVVRVSAINGTDAELSDAVTETLVTDLARSPYLSVVDARDAQATSGAQFRVVGRCLTLDNHLIVSVRVLDATTNRTVPGIADNVMGPREDILSMVDRLADRIAMKLEERPLAAPTPAPPARKAPITSHKPSGAIVSTHALPPLKVQSNMIRPLPKPPSEVLKQPAPPVAAVEDDTRGTSGDSGDSAAPAPAHDADTARDDQPLERERPRAARRYTGLIVDARGLDLERSMSPKIRREDGSTVWAGEEANPDFAIEKGIVAYVHRMSEAMDHERAGDRPLVIQAVGRHENSFRSDPILADDDAEYLLAIARRDGFLKKYNVVFVID